MKHGSVPKTQGELCSHKLGGQRRTQRSLVPFVLGGVLTLNGLGVWYSE
jgi:hypothetical protein